MLSAFLLALALAAAPASPAPQKAAPPPPRRPRVLLIGIDGCRPDALLAADAPHLHALRERAAYSFRAQTCARTVSGPSWSSLSCGVWPQRHGVLDNSFAHTHLDRFPPLFQRLHEAAPALHGAVLAQWDPIRLHLARGADYAPELADAAAVTEATIARLRDAADALLFVHYDDVDEAGHAHGYGPEHPEYLAAIHAVDAEIGKILKALHARPAAAHEDWLILVTTDHGGSGTSHGHDTPLERTIFVLAQGRAFPPGELRPPPRIIDLAPTIFHHLGITVDPAWQWQGRRLGAPAPDATEPAPFTLAIPESDATLEFLPIDGPAGRYWLSRSEVPWEVFDAFFLRDEATAEADGVTGPSRSVFPVTRGFGHEGHPALGMSLHSAQSFCAWLSKRTGHRFRLPTVAEWQAACGPRPTDLLASAWCAANSDGKPHPVARLAPNRHGLYDMLGNLAEWATDSAGEGRVCGGSYLSPVAELTPETTLEYDPSWQARDPQWPKSRWWLSDAPFVGFRVLTTSPLPTTGTHD